MKLHGLTREEERCFVDILVTEINQEGMRCGEVDNYQSGGYRIPIGSNQEFQIQFYENIGLDFRLKVIDFGNITFIDFTTGRVSFNRGSVGLHDILDLGVDDITNIKPHEYGILKLKYGLEKHQLFTPSFMKPGVRKIQNKIRGV